MTQDPNSPLDVAGEAPDAGELFERGFTRAGALRGLGGVLAAGAVGGS